MIRTALVAAFVCVATVSAAAGQSSPLKDSIRAMAQAKSYHFSMTSASHSLEGDVVNPGRYRAKSRSMDMIIIGPTTYVRTASSPWRKLSSSISGNMMDYIEKLDSTKKFTSTDLGMKIVDGQPLHAYRVMGGDMRAPDTVYLDGSNRIARVELSSGGVMRFTRFGETVSIDAPM